ncbi:MAG: CcmD family protein [Candidatus Tectomicrobia bacterium]|nr:CcmD family protein [Candidatus Tectomicrobia bacterium]
MGYLFAAYTVVWVILCVYLLRLAKQNRSLRKDLSQLRERLEAQGKQG